MPCAQQCAGSRVESRRVEQVLLVQPRLQHVVAGLIARRGKTRTAARLERKVVIFALEAIIKTC